MPAQYDSIKQQLEEIQRLINQNTSCEVNRHYNDLNTLLGKITTLEDYIFKGNGKPSIVNRLERLELEAQNIKESLSCLPDISHKISILSEERDQRKGVDLQRAGGVYQGIGQIIGVVLAFALGLAGDFLIRFLKL